MKVGNMGKVVGRRVCRTCGYVHRKGTYKEGGRALRRTFRKNGGQEGKIDLKEGNRREERKDMEVGASG